MSEAKYKVGDQVTINGGCGEPVEVLEVVELYYLNTCPRSIALRGSQLAPYVRPLAVGDWVRHIPTGASGIIGAIRDLKAAVWFGGGWSDWCVTNCERIPTEAGK